VKTLLTFFILLIFLTGMVLVGEIAGQEKSPPAKITSLKIVSLPDSLQVIITSSSPRFSWGKLVSPPRLYFDLHQAVLLASRRELFPEDPVVKRIKLSQYDLPQPYVVRVVLELARPVIYDAEIKENQFIIEIQHKETKIFQAGEKLLALEKTPIDEEQSRRYYQQALVFYSRGALVRALEELEQALKLNPQNQDALRLKERIQKEQAISPEVMAKKDLLNQHFQKGWEYYQENRYPEAIKEWEWVYSQDPTYPLVKELLERARSSLALQEEILARQKEVEFKAPETPLPGKTPAEKYRASRIKELWTETGNGKTYIQLQADEPLKYKSFLIAGEIPQLIVDFFDAILAEDFSLPPVYARNVSRVQMVQYHRNPDIVRLTIDLMQPVEWFSSLSAGNTRYTLELGVPSAVTRELRIRDMTFRDTPIPVVLNALSRIYGLNIIIGEGITKKISVSFTDVPLEDALDQIIRANGYDYLREGKEGNIIRILPGPAPEPKPQIFVRSFKLYYAGAKKIREEVAKLLTKDLGQILVDEDTNTITVIGPSKDITAVQNYLTEIDLRPTQVTIETRIIEVALSELQDMGIEWRLSSQPAGTSMEVTLPPASPPALTFSYGYLTPSEFSFLLSMLARKGKSNIASAPSVTTMNNRKAVIESGDKIPVLEETVDAEGRIIRRYVLWPVGISMEVTPQISPDGYIIMDIKPSVKTFRDWAPDGRTPIITERSTQQRVIIRDGDTLAIGGLITEEERRSMTRVPLISQIPILGEFFKRQTIDQIKTELIVCISPHIIVAKEEKGTNTPQTSETESGKVPGAGGQSIGQ